MAESALTLSVDSFWISPYAFSCYVALKEKGLPFEVRAVSLPDKDHHRPEYQRQSLTGRVPMLQHGAFMLQRLNLNGFELPPAVRRFAETQWQRPSVQDWVKRERLPYRPY